MWTEQYDMKGPASTRRQRRPRIAIALPTSMAARGLLATPVMDQLLNLTDFDGHILSPSDREEKLIRSLGETRLEWRSIYQPSEVRLDPRQRLRPPCRKLCSMMIRLLGSDFPNLAYRFNEINGFAGHGQKKAMSVDRQAREALAGNFVEPTLGWPRPKSRAWFNVLYRIYFGRWQCIPPAIHQFMLEENPDVMVLWNPQSTLIKDYLIAARKAAVPVVVVITSWDMPTTKGPICPGAELYIVNSKAMKNELVGYHHIDEKKVEVSGWPQMDVNVTTAGGERSAVLQSLGVPHENRLVVFAANSERLGRHEPSVVGHLARRISADA